MVGKLIPAILALLGLAIGAGAGYYLRPTSPEPASPSEEAGSPGQKAAADGELSGKQEVDPVHDYVKLSNQFIVPVVQSGRVSALIILSLSLEVTLGSTEKVYQVEPKLRDGFLQVMFDHANAGGFSGSFTDGSNMILLREALREVGQSVLGPMVTDVLIVDLVRQDS